MKFLSNTSTDPHYNMAFDQFCLEQLPLEEPVFYLWQNRPSVIIGISQSAYAEVNLQYLEKAGITLARRVTGGGAVYHDLQNLNYTIVGKSRDLDKDYPGYLHYMVDAINTLGVNATLSGRNDIMIDGRKCSGYAKRVYKDRLMIHGTLMFDVDIEELTKALSTPGSKLSASGISSVRSKVANLKEYLPQFENIHELQNALHSILSKNSKGGFDEEILLSKENFQSIEAMAKEKFSCWQWIFGHSPSTSFKTTKKFSCGTIEASFNIIHGLIKDLSFSGDFIGNLSADLLSNALEGCEFIKENIQDRIKQNGLSPDDFFDKMSEEEFSSFLTDI